jgi:hypothetical protein
VLKDSNDKTKGTIYILRGKSIKTHYGLRKKSIKYLLNVCKRHKITSKIERSKLFYKDA